MLNLLRKIKRVLLSIAALVDSAALPIAASSRLTSGIYYLLRGTFSREQYAFLHGRLAYRRSIERPDINTSLLRRNVHRIEKGLIMRPRRSTFALDYIRRTVDCYALAAKAGAEKKELTWARDVLAEYFSVSAAHPVVEDAKAIFESVEFESDLICDITGGRRVPYKRVSPDAPPVSYDAFLSLAKHRRSVRWFLDRKVPWESIERAIEVAAYSPTACNRQPYCFHILDDADLVSEAISIPMGTAGFAHQVPSVAVVVGRQRNYFNERDRHLIYIDGSLAAMSFVYALETQGISSCCINWPDIEKRERRMEKFLNLDPDERPIMLIAFGYPDPDGLVPNSTKKATSSFCRHNLR